MLRNLGIIKEAGRRIASAEDFVVSAYRNGRIPQEPQFTDRLLARIETELDGSKIGGLVWRAKTMSDRGRNSEEHEYGPDFLGVLEVDLPEYEIKKGFLAQAKLLEPHETMSKTDFMKLIDQCTRMLDRSLNSYVFLYSSNAIRVAPAQAILSMRSSYNPWDVYNKSIVRFFMDHLECFIGDPGLNWPTTDFFELESTYPSNSATRAVLSITLRRGDGVNI